MCAVHCTIKESLRSISQNIFIYTKDAAATAEYADNHYLVFDSFIFHLFCPIVYTNAHSISDL